VGRNVRVKHQIQAEFRSDSRGILDHFGYVLPLRIIKSRTAIGWHTPGDSVAFWRLRIRQHQKRRLQSRQQIANPLDLVDRDLRRRWITQHHRHERSKKLQLSFLELWLEHCRIRRKKSVGPE